MYNLSECKSDQTGSSVGGGGSNHNAVMPPSAAAAAAAAALMHPSSVPPAVQSGAGSPPLPPGSKKRKKKRRHRTIFTSYQGRNQHSWALIIWSPSPRARKIARACCLFTFYTRFERNEPVFVCQTGHARVSEDQRKGLHYNVPANKFWKNQSERRDRGISGSMDAIIFTPWSPPIPSLQLVLSKLGSRNVVMRASALVRTADWAAVCETP